MVAMAAVRGKAAYSFFSNFRKAVHNQPDNTPKRIRQPMAIHKLFTTPTRPSVDIKGENANESKPGVVVLAQMEHRPNTTPNAAPALGPNRTAPRITGMCIVVAFMTGSGIKPIPVIPMTNKTPHNMASVAI